MLVIADALEQQSCHPGLAGKVLTSAHLPQGDLERWDLYGELFDGIANVVLVSCHPTLPEVLKTRFAVETVKHVLMPPGDLMREIQHRPLADDELPTRDLERALRELGDWPSGRLVLVGAGYAGKVIIDGRRDTGGGIALDLGSIFDHWLGVHTRSYQDLA